MFDDHDKKKVICLVEVEKFKIDEFILNYSIIF